MEELNIINDKKHSKCLTWYYNQIEKVKLYKEKIKLEEEKKFAKYHHNKPKTITNKLINITSKYKNITSKLRNSKNKKLFLVFIVVSGMLLMSKLLIDIYNLDIKRLISNFLDLDVLQLVIELFSHPIFLI